ncbi:MAG: choice-of-anchor C family protein, partial [Thiotrichales bacterium]
MTTHNPSTQDQSAKSNPGILNQAVLKNGDFSRAGSDGATRSFSVLGEGYQFGGWTVDRNSVDLLAGWCKTPGGGQSIDLNGNQGAGAISQSFATEPGKTYTLTFLLAGNFERSTTDVHGVEVAIGSNRSTFEFERPEGWSRNDMGWQTKAVTFTADSELTTLSFNSLTEHQYCGPVISAVSVVQGLAPEASNLIANGDFLVHGIGAGGGKGFVNCAIGKQIGGWSVEKNSVDLLTQWAKVPGIGQAIDLNGNQGAGAITQVLATEPGKTYTVSFLLSGNFEKGESDTRSVLVSGGSESASFDFQRGDDWSRQNMGWQTKTFTFTATGTSTTLSFESLTGNKYCGPVIAGVTVVLDTVELDAERVVMPPQSQPEAVDDIPQAEAYAHDEGEVPVLLDEPSVTDNEPAAPIAEDIESETPASAENPTPTGGGHYSLDLIFDYDSDHSGDLPDPQNTAPDARWDDYSTTPETAISGNVLENDYDPDGDTIAVTGIVTQPEHGIATLDAAGNFTYIPNTGFTGDDVFTYEISDGNGGTDIARVTVTVGEPGSGGHYSTGHVTDYENDHEGGLPNGNSAPDARWDDYATQSGVAFSGNVLDNDIDPDGDPITVTGIEVHPTHGTVTIDAQGHFTYTPNAGFSGVDRFEYSISDGKGGCDVAKVTMTVAPVNAAPTAVNDVVNVNEDTSFTGNVLANDSDPDGDSLSVAGIAAQPIHGIVTIESDGTFTYTPHADYHGPDAFTYSVTDGKGGTSTAQVQINVNPVNDAPVARDDAAGTLKNVAVIIPVLANDSDPDGDALHIVTHTPPVNGSVQVNPDGTLTYTPNRGFTGNDSFLYAIEDGNGGSATAKVVVCVTGTNSAPSAKSDQATGLEDQPLVIDILANDTDADGDKLTVSQLGQPKHGTAALNADGTVTYTPNANFSGQDYFSYEVSDGHGGVSSAVVCVLVNPVNDAPVANNDAVVTDEDKPVTFNVLGNDTDVDGDTLSVESFTQPSYGTVTKNADGTFTYTPAADYNGSDSFTYVVTDGKGGTSTATVTIDVKPVNDAPVANNDVVVTDEDKPVTFNVLGNDTDVDGDSLSVESFTQPSHGTVTKHPDGTFTYTPNADYNGADSFTYVVTDGKGGTSTATVSLSVCPVNDAPVANNDAVVTDEDKPVTFNVLANDTDVDGDTLSVEGFTQPSYGTVTKHPDGTFTYTPAADYNGSDSFTYVVSDGKGGTSTATVNIDVKPVNDAPVANNDVVVTDEDKPVTFNVLDNDTDVDGDTLSVESFTQPSHGAVTKNADGTFTYTPAADYNGSDSFTYVVTDGKGGTSTASVSINVCAINDAPVANNDAVVTDEDKP